MTDDAPTIIRLFLQLLGTGVLALVLTTVVQGIWSALLLINLQTRCAIPWAIVVMAMLLWIMWEYAGGRWWPSTTSRARQAYLRARRVNGRVFMIALVAGACALAALTGLWIVLFQTGLMRGNSLPDFSQYPTPTVVGILVMASLVGAIAEEAGLTFGVTAYLCDSVWPGVVVHATGLLIFFALVWPFDSRRPLVPNALTDRWFWIHAVQAALVAGLALLAFRRLASEVRNRHHNLPV